MISLRIRKRRATIRCLFSYLGYRQVTIQCKQARTVRAPCGREPSELFALALEKFAGILIRREQEQRA